MLTHPLYIILIFVVAGLAAWGVSRFWTFYRDNEELNDTGRLLPLDGLRGYLALGVMAHHVVISYHRYTTGKWELLPDDGQWGTRVYVSIGSVAVAFFFMITGYLFWSKAIDSKGHVSLPRLYLNRARRVLPLYYFSLIPIILTGAVMQGFALNEPFGAFVGHLARMLMGGVLPWRELFGTKEISLVNASVHWTLRYEWKFYFALPFMAILLQNRRATQIAWVLLTGLIVHQLITKHDEVKWPYFYLGMLAAHLLRDPRVTRVAKHPAAGLAVIAVTVAALLVERQAYRPLPWALLLIPFLLIAGGNTLFGLLTFRPMRLLGTLSYSIYLLHGIVLYLGLRAIGLWLPIEQMTPATYWGWALGLVVVTVGVCGLTYRYVEYPFLKRRKHVVRNENLKPDGAKPAGETSG